MHEGRKSKVIHMYPRFYFSWALLASQCNIHGIGKLLKHVLKKSFMQVSIVRSLETQSATHTGFSKQIIDMYLVNRKVCSRSAVFEIRYLLQCYWCGLAGHSGNETSHSLHSIYLGR